MKNVRCYIIGGGLSSLAVAAYLIKDGQIPGEQIQIFEEKKIMGGCIEARDKLNEIGYLLRGYRMLEEKVYASLFDLLSFIPSLENSNQTVLETIQKFNVESRVKASLRIIANNKMPDSGEFDLNWRDQIKVFWFLTLPESCIHNISIEDYFTPSFFKSHFWIQLATTFSFQPWHSLAEFRRYILRFYHSANTLESMECVWLTPRNEYETIILPLVQWLVSKKVVFHSGTRAVDLDFEKVASSKRVSRIYLNNNSKKFSIGVNPNDLVFATIGSITSNAVTGTTDFVPEPDNSDLNSSWLLWNNLAAKEPVLGNPSAFCKSTDKSSWVSFTVTIQDPAFIDSLKSLTEREVGFEGVITLKDSNWLLSFAMTPNQFFKGQPETINIAWGYGLSADQIGNHIKKKMTECTGREIFQELLFHLNLPINQNYTIERSDCIPCYMPYITSQFMPCGKNDRPEVLPEGMTNLALIGQYCNVPKSIVFTVDHSVRSAQKAVEGLLNLKAGCIVTPVYQGYKKPGYIFRAVTEVLKQNNHFRRILLNINKMFIKSKNFTFVI